MQTLTRADIAPLGKKIYEEGLKAQLEPEDVGKYIVIDVETGEWDMDVDAYAASFRVFHRKPSGLRYAMRVGYAAAGRF